MTELRISLEENPDPADLDVIERALVEHNEARSEPRNYSPLAVFLRNGEGQIVGGLRGLTVWGGCSFRKYGLRKTCAVRTMGPD